MKTGTGQFINCMVDTAIVSDAIAKYKTRDIVFPEAGRACRYHVCQ
ncbi:MAG TPA: hypothetical protein VKO63_08495 [Chitinispirillaceae bacterium]|nr:hypothetical protein [Chitinispirillaceae bacterium]